MDTLIKNGFVDTYRFFYPNQKEAYTWWAAFSNCRARNIGWRIDYFLVSEVLTKNLKDAKIRPDIFGSDHCPVELYLDI